MKHVLQVEWQAMPQAQIQTLQRAWQHKVALHININVKMNFDPDLIM